MSQGSTSARSQAATVSALLRKKADVMPRPSGASNAREYAVIVRAGSCVDAGASIMVGASGWTRDELEGVRHRIDDALTYGGYYYHRELVEYEDGDLAYSYRTVYKVKHTHTELQRNLIFEVREYAVAHYGEHGWDVVVEAWDDTQLADNIGEARTAAGAIRNVGRSAGLYDAHRREIEATAF